MRCESDDRGLGEQVHRLSIRERATSSLEEFVAVGDRRRPGSDEATDVVRRKFGSWLLRSDRGRFRTRRARRNRRARRRTRCFFLWL